MAIPLQREAGVSENIISALPYVLTLIALARRARFDFQRSLGRIGGDRIAVAARFLSLVALLVALTAALAVGVYAVLALVLG